MLTKTNPVIYTGAGTCDPLLNRVTGQKVPERADLIITAQGGIGQNILYNDRSAWIVTIFMGR